MYRVDPTQANYQAIFDLIEKNNQKAQEEIKKAQESIDSTYEASQKDVDQTTKNQQVYHQQEKEYFTSWSTERTKKMDREQERFDTFLHAQELDAQSNQFNFERDLSEKKKLHQEKMEKKRQEIQEKRQALSSAPPSTRVNTTISSIQQNHLEESSSEYPPLFPSHKNKSVTRGASSNTFSNSDTK